MGHTHGAGQESTAAAKEMNDTPRCFPRSLQAAFPVSENYRAALEDADGVRIELTETIGTPAPRWHEGLRWTIAVALLAWLAWACLAARGPA